MSESELVWRQKCPDCGGHGAIPMGTPSTEREFLEGLVEYDACPRCKTLGFIEVVLPDDKVLSGGFEVGSEYVGTTLPGVTVSDVLAALDKEVER